VPRRANRPVVSISIRQSLRARFKERKELLLKSMGYNSFSKLVVDIVLKGEVVDGVLTFSKGEK
jgi:hypothetical protein